MAVPLSRLRPSDSATPPDFDDNNRRIRKLVNEALKEGTPLQDLHLVPKNPPQEEDRFLSRNDLLSLLHSLKRIRITYQERLSPQVPPELVRDVLAKSPEERLPWEDEAFEKAEKRKEEVRTVGIQARKELQDFVKMEFLMVDR
jgi:hypothetical protein